MADEKYAPDDVRRACIEYFDGDTLAADVVMKWLLCDVDGNFLERSPVDMHDRLASEFARIEKKYPNPMGIEEIRALFDGFKYVIPQGSPMAGIGNKVQLQSLSNCFVLDGPTDSYGGIMLTDQEQVQLMKRRGGVGFDISHIRPRGTPTSNAARSSDGIGVFMERFSNSCREVAQGGRRGALILTIDISHYDIETFIDIKRDLTKVTGANISIRVSDEFMRAVESDSQFTLQWPVDVPVAEASRSRSVSARKLWKKIVDSAWTSAEPGIMFWDTVKRESPADCYSTVGFASVSSNPCGEIVMSPYDSCRLMVLNTLSFVDDPYVSGLSKFDFDKFERISYKSQRLMDDLVDLEIECVERIIEKVSSETCERGESNVEIELWKKIKRTATSGRRTGLGVTAVGDTLAALGIRYGSEESIAFVESLYRSLAVGAHRASIDMAEERGSFPSYSYDLERDHAYLTRVVESCGKDYAEKKKKFGRRNIALTTTAPVGSVSIVAKTSSGIEPVFMLSYKRKRKISDADATTRVDLVDASGDKWQVYSVNHHGVDAWSAVTGLTDVAASPYYGSTSRDIDWKGSIRLQAAAQRWIDHSIAKTCNLPTEATRDDVFDVYMTAWKSGCKGVTVYRDGSRMGVLTDDRTAQPEDQKAAATSITESHAPKRPKSLPCDIHRVTAKGESYIALVGMINDRPYEIFCGLSKNIDIPRRARSGILIKNGRDPAGVTTYCLKVKLSDSDDDDDLLTIHDVVDVFDNPIYAALTRMLSLALRHGVPTAYIADQLRKDKNADVTSFSSAIARILSKNYVVDDESCAAGKIATCPVCAERLHFSQGCASCTCGWSKCS